MGVTSVETTPVVPVKPLAKVQGFIGRYVVVTDAQRLAIALWVVHTHCVEKFEQTPYLLITSPQRGCAKSRLLEVLELLVPRPLQTITPSEAVIYRTIDAIMPTVLLDEVDAIFSAKNADRYEGLRAILNAGHRKGAQVPRCVGVSLTPAMFDVYCAKALAGIGDVPDTIADRAIPIRMARKTRAEHVERFYIRKASAEAEPIRAGIEQFAAQHGDALAEARPKLPEELSDRMQEGCEPLLAIADTLGCGTEARAALVELLASERLDSRENNEIRLLESIRAIFAAEPDASAIRTERLVMCLNALEEWGDWYGHGLDARWLGRMLKPYQIHTVTVREGEITGKGYRRDDFYDAFTRYLPEVESE